MIDILALRKLVETGKPRVVVEAGGRVVDREDLPEVGSAALITGPLTDAVKAVEGGLVQESLDRDSLWSIEGFVLSGEVLMALDEGLTTAEELISAVTRAGFEWQLISSSSSSS